MAVIAAIIADFVWFAMLVRSFWPIAPGWNPVNLTQQRVQDLVSGLNTGVAWPFLGVAATLVVAIQVAASSNQQVRDRIADDRATRFTFAAIFTGATVMLAGVAFAVSFGHRHPGEYLAVFAAAAGITFFAADGASVVLRHDTRDADLIAIQRRLRRIRVVSRAAPKSRLNFVSALLLSTVTLALWGVLSSWLFLAVSLVISQASGYAFSPASTWPAMAALATLAVALTSLASVAVGAFWNAKAKAGEYRSIGHYLIALAAIGIGAWGVGYIGIGALQSHVPLWAIGPTVLAVAIPLVLPLGALLRVKHFHWTSGGSLRTAYAAIEKLKLAWQIKQYSDLKEVFESPRDAV